MYQTGITNKSWCFLIDSGLRPKLRAKPSESGFARKRRGNEAVRSFCGERKLDAETEQAKFDPTMRPVGQVVKTAASHAVNIGSNPVRVTTLKKAAFVRCFFRGVRYFVGWTLK